MAKNKKKLYIGLVVIMLIIITIGVSYALWVITKEQTNENILSTSCLDIELTNKEDNISLTNTFPKTDVEGKILEPYKFTIRNECENYVDYSINLEMLSETTLNSENIKVLLNKEETETEPKILSKYPENEIPKISEAKESRQLTEGRLRKLESVNYELRLWIKEEVTKESGIENEIAKSKIVVEGKIGEQVASDYIEEIAKTEETNLSYDNTKDNNLRYIGAEPNNYIDIGDRDGDGNPILWRVIGVMNNITSLDDIEKQESLVKIIRADNIGDYSWDSSAPNINNGWGVNEWSQADVMKLLNPQDVYSGTPEIGASLYWTRGKGYCYNAYSELNIPCEFTNSGLSEEVKSKIAKVRWYTGTVGEIDYSNKITAQYMYESERSNHNGKEQCENTGGIYCNDEVERKTTWDGYIGLIHPSDYGYAVGGNVRTNCLIKSINTYNTENCNLNDWLSSNTNVWTINPAPLTEYSHTAFFVSAEGYATSGGVDTFGNIKPVAYLKSNIKILENPNNDLKYGSIDNPFMIE